MGGVQAMTAASEEFGRLVRQARTKLGLSQRELAEILGVNRNETISLWERGRSIPHKTTLLRCIDQMGLDKEVVLELKDVHYDELITLKDEKKSRIGGNRYGSQGENVVQLSPLIIAHLRSNPQGRQNRPLSCCMGRELP